MNDKPLREALKVAMEKRILNEFGSKILNEERMDRVVQSRKHKHLEAHADTMFNCECDDQTCEEVILMSTEEYQRLHLKTKYFIVIPNHVRLDLEEIIGSYSTFALVAKFFPHSRG
jgi:hypothetical protein